MVLLRYYSSSSSIIVVLSKARAMEKKRNKTNQKREGENFRMFNLVHRSQHGQQSPQAVSRPGANVLEALLFSVDTIPHEVLLLLVLLLYRACVCICYEYEYNKCATSCTATRNRYYSTTVGSEHSSISTRAVLA